MLMSFRALDLDRQTGISGDAAAFSLLASIQLALFGSDVRSSFATGLSQLA